MTATATTGRVRVILIDPDGNPCSFTDHGPDDHESLGGLLARFVLSNGIDADAPADGLDPDPRPGAVEFRPLPAGTRTGRIDRFPPGTDLDTVKSLMPGNYAAYPFGTGALVEGVDVAGWTLDGYVADRLMSVLIAITEIGG